METIDAVKTKSLRNLEEKIAQAGGDSLRCHILESARNFKTSWIDLGRALHAVWSDKLYKGWGYSTFEIYTSKEIGIRTQTAMKLLKSYYFLEKEAPQYLTKEYSGTETAAAIPGYESVDLLRRAKNKDILDAQDYVRMKKEVFENGRDERAVKQDLTALIQQRREIEPEEAYRQKRASVVRRLLGTLKTIQREAQMSKMLPAPLIQEMSRLIKKLEAEME